MAERPATDLDWAQDGGRLGDVPDGLVAARERLHGLVTNVLTPARYRETGRIALRWTPGGIGTPFFEVDGVFRQIRLEGSELVVQAGQQTHRHAVTTIGAATRATIGLDRPDVQWTRDLDLHDVPDDLAPDTEVAISADAMAYLADWFGLGFSVLNRLRRDPASLEASEVQLWPEHLDPAIEVLPGKARASYGFSPGDGSSDEPYAYVSIWYPDDLGIAQGSGPWSAAGFTGAVLNAGDLVEVDDQVGYLLNWFRQLRDQLSEEARGRADVVSGTAGTG